MNDPLFDEIERLRERIKELQPYEVVSGEMWKARTAYEELEAAGRMIKQLEAERDKLNGRVKGLQAKIKEYQAPTQSSPESEGVSG